MKKCQFLRKKRIFYLNKYENENKMIIDIGIFPNRKGDKNERELF